ncbi:TraR/DksA family transcriptional regulator [Pseudomonas mandelii]|uniref:Phage/conjugal plasmid C-4 type zinc finger protein, TraR family n=1 Tax=Pseudomonas mandelii TaxID=75612 RepID=A0ABY0VUI9_9PSED|nr:TraR/DksA family transcriptional regulator [Pseudomonas mandelii]TWS08778.1 TraR/DksA family transcriptional regulator [Pseudomonas mandelii]SDU56543.1 phage/conjugal plasmid C-4 type zinc finger protein, TraR family [Pseudomonas mandelii]
MADIADFANDLVQERLDQALAARNAAKPALVAHSFLFCEGCDEPIPELRRLALPGCTRCVRCQSIDEWRESRHAQ